MCLATRQEGFAPAKAAARLDALITFSHPEGDGGSTCAYRQLLETLGLAVLVFDTSRNVVYSNVAAQAAAEACGLRLRGYRLTSKTRTLAARIDAALRTALGGVPTLVRHDHGGGVLHWLFHPYSDRTSAIGERGVIALARVCRLSGTLALFAEAYALTPAEYRVLLHLVTTGGSVKRAARISGTTVDTVRSHLQHLFQKTRTRRQSELLSLVWSLPAAPIEA